MFWALRARSNEHRTDRSDIGGRKERLVRALD